MVDLREIAKLVDLPLVEQRDARLIVTPNGMPLLDAMLPKVISDVLNHSD